MKTLNSNIENQVQQHRSFLFEIKNAKYMVKRCNGERKKKKQKVKSEKQIIKLNSLK